jgi:hypothetical protein
MAAPAVYAAITAIITDIGRIGVPKAHANSVDCYRYRSIDDVLGALSPLLSKHRLCVLPRVLERTLVERQGADGSVLLNVALRVAFDLVSSKDGTTHRVEAFGEALDPGDKATAKAMSAAYKIAMLQTFCIPTEPGEDSDASSHKVYAIVHAPEPVQGWEQWVIDIGDIVTVCESCEAIDLVQDRNRALLMSLSRERPNIYAELGQAFVARRESLRDRLRDVARPETFKRTPKRSRTPSELEVQSG